MEIKIKEEKENPLHNRKEIEFEIRSDVTPSRTDVGKLVSEKLSAGVENIEIKKISGKFGSNTFGINAFVYDSKEDRMSIERKPKLIEEKKEEISVESKGGADKDKKEVKEETNKSKEGAEEKTNASNAEINEKDNDKNNIEPNPEGSNELLTKDNSGDSETSELSGVKETSYKNQEEKTKGEFKE